MLKAQLQNNTLGIPWSCQAFLGSITGFPFRNYPYNVSIYIHIGIQFFLPLSHKELFKRMLS